MMGVLLATPEAVPFAKTGGLADVTGALIREFRKNKINAYIIMPLYSAVRKKFKLKDTGCTLSVPIGSGIQNGRVYSYNDYAFFISCDEFFDRTELYGPPDGDYPDNDRRFIFFSRGILEAVKSLGLKIGIIHCNDWQTALLPLYIRSIYKHDDFFQNTATVLTIHNLGYQGLFPPSTVPLTGFGRDMFNPEGIEFYGKVNFLKAGIISADVITTVSDTYSHEILQSQQGFGLDGVLKKRASDLRGILNGIDYAEWNPLKDKLIPANYGPDDISGKRICKAGLADRCSFKEKDAPVLGIVGRLAWQKGIDIFLEAADEIVSCGVNIAVLGRGDSDLQERLKEISKRHYGRFYFRLGYDEKLAHLIYAGSDMFLMPSRYEPCGLGQLISQRYGAIPVARMTGGIADTVMDYDSVSGSGTGFLFLDFTATALKDSMRRALSLYTDNIKWERMLRGAMKMDFSWASSAKKYIELYRSVKRKNTV